MATTNKSLRQARTQKHDEFYTLYEDIAAELQNHRNELKGKVVYCNCDDPTSSNFVRYLCDNFNAYGLKALIATHYIDPQTSTQKPVKLTVSRADSAEGFIRELTTLEGDGDFRSEECIAILNSADIVITNPPFSLWRDFIDLIIDNNKTFILLGTIHAINYQSILDGVKAGKITTGYTNFNKTLKFAVPEHYDGKTTSNTTKYAEVHGICWWTNLPVTNRTPLQLSKFYSPDLYPKYEAKNTKGKPTATAPVDAINVDRVADIPCNYDGLMGVPITIIGQLDYNQFEVVGKLNNGFIGDKKVFSRILIRRRATVTATATAPVIQIYVIAPITILQVRQQAVLSVPARQSIQQFASIWVLPRDDVCVCASSTTPQPI